MKLNRMSFQIQILPYSLISIAMSFKHSEWHMFAFERHNCARFYHFWFSICNFQQAIRFFFLVLIFDWNFYKIIITIINDFNDLTHASIRTTFLWWFIPLDRTFVRYITNEFFIFHMNLTQFRCWNWSERQKLMKQLDDHRIISVDSYFR